MRWAIRGARGAGESGLATVGASAMATAAHTTHSTTARSCRPPTLDGARLHLARGWRSVQQLDTVTVVGHADHDASTPPAKSGGMLLVVPTPTVVNARGGCRRIGAALTTAGRVRRDQSRLARMAAPIRSGVGRRVVRDVDQQQHDRVTQNAMR